MTIEQFRNVQAKVKKLYKEYESNKNSIIDICNIFKIEINEMRLDDYEINIINYYDDNLYVELVDKKTNTVYNSKYTNQSNLSSYSGCMYCYIDLSITPLKQNYIINKLYSEETGELLIERISIDMYSNNIQIDKYYPNEYLMNNDKRVVLTLNKEFFTNKGIFIQPLLQRISEVIPGKNNDDILFEQKTTVMPVNHMVLKNTQDKYCFTSRDNLIYGVKYYNKENVFGLYYGLIALKNDEKMNKYMPIYMRKNPFIYNVKSVISFVANEINHHEILINKVDDMITIHYKVCDGLDYDNILINKVFQIKSQSYGIFKNSDIEKIICFLDKLYNNNFITALIQDLETYLKRLKIKNGDEKDSTDILDTNLLINADIYSIAYLLSTNRYKCFEILYDELNELSSNFKTKEDNKVKNKKK